MRLYAYRGFCVVGWIAFFGVFTILASLVLDGVNSLLVVVALFCAVIAFADDSYHQHDKWHGK